MKVVVQYDLNIKNAWSPRFASSPYFFNGNINYAYSENGIVCKKVSLDGTVYESTCKIPSGKSTALSCSWEIFEYNGHVILSCGNSHLSPALPNKEICSLFLDLDNDMTEAALPKEIKEQHLCRAPINETEDVELLNCVMKYKNSRRYQCTSLSGDFLWEEKHRGYRYTDFEEKNDCIIFGTAGFGGGLYCYRKSDGACLADIDTKGTARYVWQNEKIVCRSREGGLLWIDPYTNSVSDSLKLNSLLNDESGIFADSRYVCTVGFHKKTASPTVYLIDTLA